MQPLQIWKPCFPDLVLNKDEGFFPTDSTSEGSWIHKWEIISDPEVGDIIEVINYKYVLKIHRQTHNFEKIRI